MSSRGYKGGFTYYETEAMQGEKPFFCYNCGKMLMINIEGEYTIKMRCARCKTVITVERQNPVPDILMAKHAELLVKP